MMAAPATERDGICMRAVRPAPYSIGCWLMLQATGSDWDGDVITDSSGQGAHATLGLLSKAEAGAHAGWLTCLNEAGHSGQIPRAAWRHRYRLGSKVTFGRTRATPISGNKRILGNGISTNITGDGLCINGSGNLVVNLCNTSTTGLFSGATTGGHWLASSEHTWVYGWDWVTGGVFLGIDSEMLVIDNQAIPRAAWLTADDGAAVAATYSIGGRPAGATDLLPDVQMASIQAYTFDGLPLPRNLAALFGAYHSASMQQFELEDFEF